VTTRGRLVVETFELEVAALPPGPNAMRGAHWTRVRRERADVGYAVLASWAAAGRPRARGRHAFVHVHIVAPGRPDDLDNRLARCKQLLDQLVVCGALADDSERFLEIDVPTRERGSPGRCRVTIRYDREA
jgi:hypothetical protein